MPKAPREPNYWWWSHLNWHHHKYVTPPVPYPENFWSRYAGLGAPKINPKTRAVLHPKVSFYQTHFFCVEFIQRWTSWTLSFESTKVCPKKNKLQTQQPQMQQLQTPTRLPFKQRQLAIQNNLDPIYTWLFEIVIGEGELLLKFYLSFPSRKNKPTKSK